MLTIVKDWNKNYPPGTEVELINDDGQIEKTKTRSVAWLLGSGTPVVEVDGRAGGYLLTRIRPAAQKRHSGQLIVKGRNDV